MRAPTDEEIRAENYRRDREKGRRAMRDRKRKLRGNAGAAAELQRKTRALMTSDCGDTSYAENRK
jgi:hypothetical protein